MAKFLGGYDSATAQQTTASYGPIAQARMFAAESAARVQLPMPDCTIRNLHIYVVSYISSTTTTVTVQKNGANTALAIAVVGSGTGHFQNITDSATFASGDIGRLNLASGLQSSLGPVSFEQELAGDGLVGVYSLNASVASNTTGRLHYRGAGQTSSLYTSPSAALDVVSKMTASMDRLRFIVVTNSKAAARTLTARVNNADSTLSVTVPASTTGVFESVSSPISIVPGDTISFVYDSLGTTGTIQGRTIDYRMTTADDLFDVLVGGDVTVAASADRYAPVIQGLNLNATVDTAVKTVVPFDTVASLLRAYIASNSSTNAWSITLQKNSADTALSLAIPSGGSGYFEDATNTVALTAGDNIAYRVSTRNSSVNFTWLGFSMSSGAAAVTIAPETGELEVDGIAPALVAGAEVTARTGELTLLGTAPVLSEFSGVAPATGSLVIEGAAPEILSDLVLDPASGVLRLTGRVPGVYVGVTVAPLTSALQVDGLAPVLFTFSAAASSQVAALALVTPDPPTARGSQVAALALGEPPPPPTRASQVAMLGIGEVVPDVLASQAAMLILAHGSSCVTERCQIWKITRRDGVVFRFTSHDRPVTYGREVYKSCRSLNPSASENASTIGSVGNIELMGIIDDEAITEADLYGGLFDDAFVTVDLIVWGAGTEAPRRLAAGWTGSLSQGETGFKMEVLGPGARLEQQALVQMVTPGCRWVFGSTQCGVNADALALVGAVVSARTRGVFKATLPASPAGRQWENGRVRWTSGVNAGQITETKTVDFATGEIVLWASPGFLPEPGDGFDLIPGCDFNRDGGCTVYANVINFGGFPDLPGADAILETPVAQY